MEVQLIHTSKNNQSSSLLISSSIEEEFKSGFKIDEAPESRFL
jgi:hypothetical protein